MLGISWKTEGRRPYAGNLNFCMTSISNKCFDSTQIYFLSISAKVCPDGSTATCIAQHGNGCANLGLQWRCIDNKCHCIKY